ncbi:MAG: hypothetical protein FWG34_12605 [Oscillospiraceae bacterium]|nr:hypothetical protein [Oscillospiraceae bacterium]
MRAILYILRDRVDEGGNQKFGLFTPENAPRKAAHYLHNMAAVLNMGEKKNINSTEQLSYAIHNISETVHELLLQKSEGEFYLILWDERFTGGKDEIEIEFPEIPASIEIYDATESAEPLKSLEPEKYVNLVLSDHPVIVKIKYPLFTAI